MNKQSFLKLIMGIFLSIGIMISSLFPYIWGNYTGSTFYGPGSMPGLSNPFSGTGNGLTDSAIATGAGYFLKAYSDFLLFSNRIEISGQNGIDYSDLSSIINDAVSNLEQTAKVYGTLNRYASITPYNTIIIDKLMRFDYDSFCKERSFNPFIYLKVRGFLSTGNVRGLYSQISIDIDGMLTRLYDIKKSVDEKRFPAIKRIWEVNRSFAETLLFGQYTSEIFDAIININKEEL
jgi:hypothetical protein